MDDKNLKQIRAKSIYHYSMLNIRHEIYYPGSGIDPRFSLDPLRKYDIQAVWIRIRIVKSWIRQT